MLFTRLSPPIPLHSVEGLEMPSPQVRNVQVYHINNLSCQLVTCGTLELR